MKALLILKTNKKRTILAASVLGVGALIIGGTIAYSQDSSSMNNKFQLFSYRTLFTETFDPPSGWQTCETIDKTITVKNEYDNPVSVRLKLEEQWIASDGTTELPLISATSGYQMAQINFATNSGWTKQGNYYYYDIDLPKNGVTTTPITGVTLNCDVNLDVDDPTADGVYANANYHLKITAQSIEAAGKTEWGRTLYNVITSRANNGVDSNLDLSRGAIKEQQDPNGAGINIRSGTENDDYPIYYFRGNIDDNYVVWGDFCWRVVRTTETGGTKMIYQGTSSNSGGNITCSQAPDGIYYNSTNSINYSDFVELAASGYMYGDSTVTRSFLKNEGITSSTVVTIANHVNYFNGQYQLINTVSGVWSDIYRNAYSDHKYICLSGTTNACSRVGFIQAENSSSFDYVRFFDIAGYESMDDFATRKIWANQHDSVAKQNIDGWFEQFLISRESDLDDTVFCNDRYMTAFQDVGNYYGHSDVYRRNDNSDLSIFAPTLTCRKKADSFTKNDTVRGNGSLIHSIGLITADELTFSGLLEHGGSSSQGVFIGSSYGATMSPADVYAGYILRFEPTYYSEQYPRMGLRMRPVVSLKNSVEITVGGTGKSNDPYIVE